MMASLARTALRRTLQPSHVGQLSAIRLMATERANKCVKPGEAIVIDGVPHRISKITQGKRGKGGGYVRAVCRNLLTGGVFDKTYNSDEDVEVADLRKDIAQYTWKDGDMFCFQDTKTFDEVKIDQALIDNHEFLVEGSEVKLMSFGERVIGVELTRFQDYQVMSINEKSMAKLDCGAVVHVPPFIQQGMMIRVNTHDATFSERA